MSCLTSAALVGIVDSEVKLIFSRHEVDLDVELRGAVVGIWKFSSISNNTTDDVENRDTVIISIELRRECSLLWYPSPSLNTRNN